LNLRDYRRREGSDIQIQGSLSCPGNNILQIMGGVVSDDLALVNNPNRITQDVRLLDNVGGEDDSDSLLVDFLDKIPDGHGGLGIKP